MTLQVEQLFSGYRNVPVVKDVSFNIEAGEVVALIGLNGAGKSTLLKTILGLLPALKGRILLNGQTILDDHASYARQVAYIPETPVLYEELTLKEHLEMTALGYGIPIETVMERAEPLLTLFRLEKHLSWFPSHFSKGMKQKVMVICALVTDAKLLIIDEPFLGLDPLAIKHFTELLQERAQQGTAILLTTHVLGIADALCNRYIMLQAGEIVVQGDLAQLQQALGADGATLDELYVQMAQAGGAV